VTAGQATVAQRQTQAQRAAHDQDGHRCGDRRAQPRSNAEAKRASACAARFGHRREHSLLRSTARDARVDRRMQLGTQRVFEVFVAHRGVSVAVRVAASAASPRRTRDRAASTVQPLVVATS